jgi:hypothetical protein
MSEMETLRADLKNIGSVYVGGLVGWRHLDATKGKPLVRRICEINEAIFSATSARPAAWGPRGERGTVICISCGKRGQDRGCVCDHCGHAV